MTEEYIKKADAVRTVLEKPDMTQDEKAGVARRLQALPAADVVEVVRCRECKHYDCEDGDQKCVKDAEWVEDDACYYGLISYHGPESSAQTENARTEGRMMYEQLVKSLRICGDSVDAIDECCYEECIQHKRPIDPLCMQALCNKAADAIEELSKPRWIPVTERLPEEPGRYLCRYRVEDNETIGYCTDFGRYDPERGEWYANTVTHWMPLPEPPKEESNG